MRLAIEFDNKSRLWTEEIRNVRPNSRLAAKAKPGKLLSAQQRPELPFSVGHIPTKLSSAKLGQSNTPLPSLRDTFPLKGGRKIRTPPRRRPLTTASRAL